MTRRRGLTRRWGRHLLVDVDRHRTLCCRLTGDVRVLDQLVLGTIRYRNYVLLGTSVVKALAWLQVLLTIN